MEPIYKAFSVVTKAVDVENGIYEAMITTEAPDRTGDIVRATGAQINDYMKNPIVLWAHQYDMPPVAKALSITVMPGQGLKAVFQFPPLGTSPDADTIHKLWAGGFLNATSIGFIPLIATDIKGADGGGWMPPQDYQSWEMLEFSIVPVPANQDALRLAMKTLATPNIKSGRTLSAANEKKIKDAIAILNDVLKAVDTEQESYKSAVPYADHGTSEGDWSKPTLGNFTDSQWGDLSDADKKRIMNHYAWTANNPPDTFGDLKLPHHTASKSGVGAAVWHGVSAAMGALMGAQGGVDIPDGDRKAVYNHLSKHYAEFKKEPPDYKDITGIDPVIKTEEAEPNTDLTPNDESEANAELIIKTLKDLFGSK